MKTKENPRQEKLRSAGEKEAGEDSQLGGCDAGGVAKNEAQSGETERAAMKQGNSNNRGMDVVERKTIPEDADW